MRLYLLILSLASLLLSACQSSPVKQFDKIQAGMEKNEVLDLMGPPRTTTRLHGKDRWIYVFYEDKIRYEKEVHFQSGNAVYVGDAWKPAPEKSAEAKDLRTKEEDLAYQEEQKKNEEERSKAYADYEKAVKSENKIRYMPDFIEIK